MLTLLILGFFLGFLFGVAKWTYLLTIRVLDEMDAFLYAIIGHVVRFARFLYYNWSFMSWRRNRLPELKQKTRLNDQTALAERIKKSEHIGSRGGERKPYE